MNQNDQAIEEEIVAKGKTAPRVTPDDILANIRHIETVKHVTQSGQVLRWAVLVTQSGFAVVGKPSVAVSPENDDAEIGEQVAFDNSRNELWPLMGYALKQELHRRAVLDASPKVGTGPGLDIKTKTYADGTTATGVAPLPDTTPAEQERPRQHVDITRESGSAPGDGAGQQGKECRAGADLPPHQKRVIEEKRELDERRQKLEAFFDTSTFAQLDADEQGRLNAQYNAMATLSRILSERISVFVATAVQ